MAEETNPKKEQIINTAKSLFYKFGMKRVSIEEICREANVSKMTFYKYYQNKKDLIMSMLRRMMSDAIDEYKLIIAQKIPFVEKVKQTIQMKMRQTNELSMDFFNELYQTADEDVITLMNQRINESLQLVYQDYAQAQKKGDIRSDIKLEFIIYFLNHVIEMAEDDRLIRLYEKPQDLVMELTNFFFYGILPMDKHLQEGK